MKKLLLIAGILIACGIVVTSILVPPTSGVNYPVKVKTNMPPEVKSIVTHSCTPCHFDGGNGMALANINFSSWETYNDKKQSKKSGAMCKAIVNKVMPPSGFATANPDKVPTKEQAEVICKWAEGLVYVK